MEKLEQYRNETEVMNVPEIIKWALNEFGTKKIALASAFGPESQYILSEMVIINEKPRIFTIDTGRLFQETYNVIQETISKYNVAIEVHLPDSREVADMTSKFGPNLFYDSVENRKLCCKVRKVQTLNRVLSTVDAWMSGLRRGQSETRDNVHRIEWDISHKIYKINPMINWSEEQVWAKIKEHNIPYNRLADYGYRSIGCTPCTRAIGRFEDMRAGRWWWESEDYKECGIHGNLDYQI